MPFRRRERWAWWALALGTALWFVLDTGISAGHGVGINVAINLTVLVLIGVPLAATRVVASKRDRPGST